jgi:hypothetical protein
MTNILTAFLALMVAAANSYRAPATLPVIIPANNCVSFSIGPGTGCAWMCSYCANALGTSDYYFTDGVCTYEQGGCVGNPQASVTYTCCSSSSSNFTFEFAY